ncbi:MAG TPA: gephyrin-like molybdotransferase Glp [Thermoleophilaceae bacterium]|nr:gephyrin-like molybdotransferase Glp [Thermoleophilaceae bacterium]
MTEPIPIAEARRRVLASIRPLDTEDVPVSDALGRVLAEDVTSEVAVPPFDGSAMDGFALPAGAEGRLEVVGESRAGHPWTEPLQAGTAVRISTGAAVPDGTAAVVPVENVTEGEGEGAVEVPPTPDGANVRLRGEDVQPGDVVLPRGAELSPPALGVLASVGRTAARCTRRPLVAILATGDELTEPGAELAPGAIWSSNPLALAGQVVRAGGVVERTLSVPDDAEATRSAIGDALGSADVVCVSGGVSVGPHDHVKGALGDLGVEESFWGVALRPGKPTWFGTLDGGGRRVLAFGLPGNPVSAMVTFRLFAMPALRALQGADPGTARAEAVLDEPVARHPRRDQAVRCRLTAAADGLHARPTGRQESHILTSMLAADALALITLGEGEVPAGERVEVELLGGVPRGLSSRP